MYSANAQMIHVPAFFDTVERTSTPITNREIAEKRRDWSRSSFAGSAYLESQNVFNGFETVLERLRHTPTNWNSYNSPPPAESSVKNAKPVLQALRTKLLQPDRILPSAEGGVAFTFVSDTASRAVIEALNDGETFVLLYDLSGNSITIDWPTTLDAQLGLISQLANHLRSDGIALKGQ